MRVSLRLYSKMTIRAFKIPMIKFHCGLGFEYFVGKHTAVNFDARFLNLTVDYQTTGTYQEQRKAKFTGGLIGMGVKFYF
ncbi:MAG TPA: hypothetical protein EYP21_07080 [Syntrophaceae bacterium]|nr:hypothetical protein [Syntrophaceae bacterium]